MDANGAVDARIIAAGEGGGAKVSETLTGMVALCRGDKMSHLTFRLNPPTYDHDTMFYDGNFIGFRSHKDGHLGLERCPECGRENWAMAVVSGECCWCGFDVNKLERLAEGRIL